MSGNASGPLTVPVKLPVVADKVVNGRTGQTTPTNDPAWMKFFQNVANLLGDTAATLGIGAIQLAVAAPASNWLACNGAAVSRAGYAALFALVGTTFGSGDGSTTFNLPNIAAPAAGTTYFVKASS